MASSLGMMISMMFGDEVTFEAFSCPGSMEMMQAAGESGELVWAKSGVPVAVKGSLRMEGASEIIHLMALNAGRAMTKN
jgi:hypothetical protein